jgi:1-aminocyclopropane-1-carboxylate deaminase/D-cysteine desulfhydrase-like pyridoxal-dependent ACC family enzyme
MGRDDEMSIKNLHGTNVVIIGGGSGIGFATPVEKLEYLVQAIHAPQLYVKRDDLSDKLYECYGTNIQ